MWHPAWQGSPGCACCHLGGVLVSWRNLFLTEYLEIKQKSRILVIRRKLCCIAWLNKILNLEEQLYLRFSWSKKPVFIPSPASENSTFWVSWSWWNSLTVCKKLLLCPGTSPHCSEELWELFFSKGNLDPPQPLRTENQTIILDAQPPKKSNFKLLFTST